MRLLKWLFQPAYLLLIIVLVTLYVNREAIFPEEVTESLEAEALAGKVDELVARLRSEREESLPSGAETKSLAQSGDTSTVQATDTSAPSQQETVLEQVVPDVASAEEAPGETSQSAPLSDTTAAITEAAPVEDVVTAVADVAEEAPRETLQPDEAGAAVAVVTETAPVDEAATAVAGVTEEAPRLIPPAEADDVAPAVTEVVPTGDATAAPLAVAAMLPQSVEALQSTGSVDAVDGQSTDAGPEGSSAPAQEEPPLVVWRAARAAVWQGDLDAAVAHYRQLITLQPENFDAYGEMGNVFLAQSDAAAAMEAYISAARLIRKAGHSEMAYRLASVVAAMDEEQGRALFSELSQQK